ncbi:hypothetical protein V5799_031220, partial [Amblyomma americanum]
MVSDVMSLLASKQLLNNTYVFFTSDNGYHLGFTEGCHIWLHPFLQGAALNVDLAPTFLDLAGLPPHGDMDGVSLKPLLLDAASSWPRESFLVEYTGEGEVHDQSECHAPYGLSGCDPAVKCECEDSWNNTYLCTRHISGETNIKFCMFDDDE